ncbi:hypothetical protein HHX47_DHR1000786 [Lentinula edodes]|nr:hypothetical protein HHX47_DHR1000786 [Lentinula edodes]
MTFRLTSFSDCQENGIWAWDPMKNTRVLLLVCVLALLGDNPMQRQDFWSLVDAWFIPKRKEFGEKLTDPRWRA